MLHNEANVEEEKNLLLVYIHPILDTRISVCPSVRLFVTLVLTPLDSETGLIEKTKGLPFLSFFFFGHKKIFLELSDFLKQKKKIKKRDLNKLDF